MFKVIFYGQHLIHMNFKRVILEIGVFTILILMILSSVYQQIQLNGIKNISQVIWDTKIYFCWNQLRRKEDQYKWRTKKRISLQMKLYIICYLFYFVFIYNFKCIYMCSLNLYLCIYMCGYMWYLIPQNRLFVDIYIKCLFQINENWKY